MRKRAKRLRRFSHASFYRHCAQCQHRQHAQFLRRRERKNAKHDKKAILNCMDHWRWTWRNIFLIIARHCSERFMPAHIFEKQLDGEYECYCGEIKKTYQETSTHFGTHPKLKFYPLCYEFYGRSQEISLHYIWLRPHNITSCSDEELESMDAAAERKVS